MQRKAFKDDFRGGDAVRKDLGETWEEHGDEKTSPAARARRPFSRRRCFLATKCAMFAFLSLRFLIVIKQ